MNLEEINLIKLKELKLIDLINRKNEDRMSLIDTIISNEKKINKEKITNEYINNRWFELKTMNYESLLRIYINNELSKLTPEQIKEEIEFNKYADKIIRIYDNSFSKIASKHGNIEFVNKQILELEKNNIDIININSKLIYYIQRNKDRYSIGNMVEYLQDVYEFFKPELKNEYIIVCYSDYDDIKYSKAKIIGNLKDINLKSKKLESEDIETVIDLDNDKFIGEEDIHDHKCSFKKTMDHIKSMFPQETKFVMVNL